MSAADRALCLRPATELTRLVRNGELSATELLDAHLAQIDRVNPKVNAICTLEVERARESAARLDTELANGAPAGALCGLPIVIKDLIDVAGMPTTRGSPLFRDAIAERDALVVERIRAAGAVVLGKSNVPELGAGSHTFNTLFGATCNPWDLSRSAGGSSGGGAAALSSGMVPIADGSDLGGSVRNPPSFNSVVGLRPTPGTIPRVPNSDPWGNLSVLGPMGRTVGDAALLLSVMAGADARDPLSFMGSLEVPGRQASPAKGTGRVAWSPDLGMFPVQGAVREVIERALPQLADLGYDVQTAHPDLTGAAEAFDVLRALGFLRNYGADLEQHRRHSKDTVVWNIERGLELDAAAVARADIVRGELFHRMREFLLEYEFLLLPVSQVAPFPIELDWVREIEGVPMHSYIDWMQSCSCITLTAHPALALPCGFTADGLPVGVQIVGPYRGERRLLELAAAWEAALGVAEQRPAIATAEP